MSILRAKLDVVAGEDATLDDDVMPGKDATDDNDGSSEDDSISGDDVITNDDIIVGVDTEGVGNGSKRRSVLNGSRRSSVELDSGPMRENMQSNIHIITLHVCTYYNIM